MGYTHYYDGLACNAEMAQAVADIVDHAKAHGIGIRGGGGYGEPVIVDCLICLNGDADKGYDHETFYVPAQPDPSDFQFCKTARKPYDAVVVATLIWAILNDAENAYKIGSDGTWEDWSHDRGGYGSITGAELYEEVFGPIGYAALEKIRQQIG